MKFFEMQSILPHKFYARDTIVVARELIGKRLVRTLPGGKRVAGRIVETEAYLGIEDPAAHSFGGRMTARTSVMFGEAGRSYIYFIYGIHYCLNVVTCDHGTPEAVLIRAMEPVEGLDFMQKARMGRLGIANGPGKLCQALGLERRHNNLDLTAGLELWIEDDDIVEDSKIIEGPRIGIGYAGDAIEWPLRFGLLGSPHLSAKFNTT